MNDLIGQDKLATNLQPTCNQLATDTISRQAAIDAVNHICPVDTEYDCTLLDRVDVRCVLLDLPPAERKKGRWVRIYANRPKQYTRICSECRETSWFCGIGDYNYCPWCGAKMANNYRHLKGADMRGEEDGND